jgi:hypothetical protein
MFKFLLAFSAIFNGVLCSEVEQAKYAQKGKLKPRAGGMKKSRSVQMTFPNSHFGSDTDWKAAGVVDEQTIQNIKGRTSWKDVSWSQHGEDTWLMNNWFYGVKDGVIIESGALDGVLFSNSNLFESFLGWTSILVEADPENYRYLRLNRPNAVTVNGALCSEPRLLHYSSLGVIPVRGFVEFM